MRGVDKITRGWHLFVAVPLVNLWDPPMAATEVAISQHACDLENGHRSLEREVATGQR